MTTLTVSRIEKEFVLTSPYDPNLVSAIRALPARKWNPTNKTWHVPESAASQLHGLINRLDGYEIEIPEDVRTELTKSAVVAEQSIEESKAVDAEIDLPVPEGLAYLPYQRAGIAYGLNHQNVLFGDEMGLGKSQPVSETVLTPSGWRTIGDLRPGDQVIGSDGRSTAVLSIYPQGVQKMVRVQMNDNSWTRASWDHLWSVQHVRNHTAARYVNGAPWLTLTTREIVDRGLRDVSGNLSWRIPMVGPIEYAPRGSLPLHPYLLGILLGDGGLSRPAAIRYTTADSFLIEQVRALLPAPDSINWRGKYDYSIRGTATLNALRKLKLMGHRSESKFIPDDYLYATPSERLTLLRGLLDTDGCARADGIVEFSSASSTLAEHVHELVCSLGGVTRRHVKKTTRLDAHRVYIKMPSGMNPFLLPRKAAAWVPPTKYQPTRIIESVIDAGEEEAVCIRVAAPDQLYITRNFIVTHNTIQAIGVSNADPSVKSVLIICPASLRLNWMREWRRWDVKKLSVGIENGAFPTTDVVVINYDVLKNHRDAIHSRQWDMLVCDEAHYLKNPKAQRTALVFGKWDRNPEKIIPAIEARRKLMLTGTPIPNRPIEMFTILKALAPDVFGNWKGYVTRYCAGHYGGYGWDVSGASNLGELQEKLRSSIMVRRLKQDVLTELPAKRRQMIEFADEAAAVQKETAAWQAYQDKLESLRVSVELAKAGTEAQYDAAVSALKDGASAAFAEMSKLRHATAIAKVPLVIEHLANVLEDGKVICFAHHRDVIAKIVEAFPDSVSITGDTKLEDRQAAVDRFQSEVSCKLFVGNIKAAGVGITLTASSHVVFAELDWVPASMTQAEDRAHRIGQKESVLVQHLVLEGSLDAVMAKRIIQKQAIIDKALDKEPTHEEQLPVLPSPDEAATESTSRKKIAEVALTLTPEQIGAVHLGLQMLSGVCDGAHSLDGAGFNKLDTRIGHSLAEARTLSSKQAALGMKLVKKYRRQLPESVLGSI